MLALDKRSSLIIKPVGPFDLGRLSRLHKQCFEEGWSRTDLAHLLALPGGFGLIARLGDGGFARRFDNMLGAGFSLCRVVRDECELLSIGVAPDYRRRSVATTLLRESMRLCHEAGALRMFLEVAIDNDHARQLYEAHGFECVGTRPDYYVRADGTRTHAYTMRCDLAGAPLGAEKPVERPSPG